MSPDLSVKQVAETIGMHPVNVSALIRRGYFPHAYKGGRGENTSPWRVPASDVEAYRRTQPRPEYVRER